MKQVLWREVSQELKMAFMRRHTKETVTTTIHSNIHVGDLVVFTDGSYTLMIDVFDWKCRKESLGLNTEIWQVISINQPVPTDPSGLEHVSNPTNNIIVKNYAGDIAFCSSINICVIEVNENTLLK